jgi:sec-independent protein translocase protein TatC
VARAIPWRRRRTEERRTGSMSVLEHLQELRHRIIVAIVAIAIGMVPAWFLWEPFQALIRAPYCDLLAAQPQLAPPTGCELVLLGAVEPVIIKLKVVLVIGFVIAMPIVLYQLWAFIVPGLTDRERRYAVPFILSATVLFLLGAFVAYLTLPKALGFMIGFAGSGFVTMLTADKYIGLVVILGLAFGASFLLPVVLVFLQMVGILSPRRLAGFRRWAFLSIAVFAAVITPSSDPFSMLALMIPMYVFYEASIIVGRAIKR